MHEVASEGPHGPVRQPQHGCTQKAVHAWHCVASGAMHFDGEVDAAISQAMSDESSQSCEWNAPSE